MRALFTKHRKHFFTGNEIHHEMIRDIWKNKNLSGNFKVYPKKNCLYSEKHPLYLEKTEVYPEKQPFYPENRF